MKQKFVYVVMRTEVDYDVPSAFSDQAHDSVVDKVFTNEDDAKKYYQKCLTYRRSNNNPTKSNFYIEDYYLEKVPVFDNLNNLEPNDLDENNNNEKLKHYYSKKELKD